MKIRPEIMRFAEAMEKTLQKHDKKKGDSWKKTSFNELKELLIKEIQELPEGYGNFGEYVDVANFCMFLWWKKDIVVLDEDSCKGRI